MNNEDCFFDETGLKPCEEQAMDCQSCEYFADNVKFVVTPEYLLYSTLDDFGIQVGEFKKKLWENIFNDFMDNMEKAEYISKVNEDE